MRITIVHGFFLPVPPAAGGAMEKAWWALAKNFAAHGHEVVSISRTWQDWPREETREGVRCLRFSGYDHTSSLPRNLMLDALWGMRLIPRLPRADILITNTVLLPAIAPWLRSSAGRVVVNLNRVPKGQLRSYRQIARLQVPSAAVAEAVREQCPRLLPITQTVPNPIELERFAISTKRKAHGPEPVRIGYFGRIHPEKGLDMLIAAANELLNDTTLPPWTLELRGPVDIPRGGGGAEYLQKLQQAAATLLASNRLVIAPPEFDAQKLAAHYSQLDVFVYPSLADQGETFGVAVAEAMAAGAVPVVSNLLCFQDMVKDGENGLVFRKDAADASTRLAQAIAQLIRDPDRRRHLSIAAQTQAKSYGVDRIAESMLDDFSLLLSKS